MFFAYQQEPSETQWAGTIQQIDMADITRVEFGTVGENEEKCLHVFTKHDMITIKRADAIKSFRDTYNQHLYQCNFVQHFVPEKPDEPSETA